MTHTTALTADQRRRELNWLEAVWQQMVTDQRAA